ncbi:hypothetical protein [Blastopirellula retiformator]|uniref:Uncharacterized protein n=1 Tax=Blastopirellula retiformator TaxID=2527970 RepID=A0A5C5VIB4_9BACT|nr:hypothetical protein [Blastopirellula retiformator]TWT38346.1 hypothetical protein Enr8_00380 [Blastopirellula retiformator]
MDPLRVLQAILFCSIPIGLLAILAALYRLRVTAQLLAALCILIGAMLTLGLAFQLMFSEGVTIFAVSLAPAALGGVALVVDRYARNRPALKRFQVSIPLLLYGTLVIGCFFAFDKFSEGLNRRALDFRMTKILQIKEIENVVPIGAGYGVPSDVDEVEFSLAGHPDSRMTMGVSHYYVTDDYIYGPSSPNRILQIRDRKVFAMVEHIITDPQGNRWRMILNDKPGLRCDFNGRLNELIPLEIKSIDALVQHYDELADIVEKWPGPDNPGKHTNVDGSTITYLVEESPTASH